MPKFYDSEGKTHTLGEMIGRGGEGTVYFCEGNDELVAKIYHEPISDEKATKLRLMAENKNERLLKVAAWVVETLHDKPNGKTVGFLMPSIKAKEIHELYSLKSRRRHFPQATWHYLIHTSANLARAFYSFHKYSHVIGDVNHGNCVVLADGTVKLIDCDSYAISDGEKRFRCDVGVATHLAPELQKSNLSEIERKPEHDNFALAVVIFQLLFLGRHPFAGNYLGEKDKTLEDCIREFRFAYGKNAKSLKVKQPPGTLDLDEVSPRVAELFERAFDKKSDNRPTPREWIEALVDMSEKLVQCGINPGHRFYSELVACPWCRIESQTGLMLFPFIISEDQTADGKAQFNIFTVEKLIENLGKPGNLPVKLEKNYKLQPPEPAQEIIESTTLNRNHQFLFVGGYFVGLVFLNLLFGLFIGTILGIFLMIFLFSSLSRDSKKLQSNLMNELHLAEHEWGKLEKQFALTASPDMLAGDVRAVREKVKNYKNFQLNTRKELKQLEANHKHRKFTDYLRNFRLKDQVIEGVSDKTRNELIKKRVWTAADVDRDRLLNNHKVNSFVADKLVEWREGLEKTYTYEDSSKKLKEKKEEFLENTKTKRRKIEQEIEQALEGIQKSSVKAQKNQKFLIPKSEEIYKKILQSKSNLSAVGDTSVALASLILITILVPFFGGIASEVSTSRSGSGFESSDTYDTQYPSSSTGMGDGAARDAGGYDGDGRSGDGIDYSYLHGGEFLSRTEANNLAVPAYNITQQEIENLDAKTRKKFSDNLVRQAIRLVKNSGAKSNARGDQPIDNAISKAFLAMRVETRNVPAFEEFGTVLYNHKYYEKCVSFLLGFENDIEKTNISQIYIGMSHLRLENYEQARDAFLYVTKKDAASASFFNLGLAYKGLEEYKKAAEAYKTAIAISPLDADNHYELGYMYYKLKDKEAFNKQYAKLLDLNPQKAKLLLENSYKLKPSAEEIKKSKTIDTPTAIGDLEGQGVGSGRGVGRSGAGSGSGRGVGSGFGTGSGTGSGGGRGN